MMYTFTQRSSPWWLTCLLGWGLLLFSAGCEEDEGFVPPVAERPSTAYRFTAVNGSAIAGYVSFTKNEDNSTDIALLLEGTESGNTYPATLRTNSAAEDGEVVIALNPVNGAGRSVTTVSQTDTGTPITYEELLDFDGQVKVERSDDDDTVVAETDIGGNELTGTVKTYPLSQQDNSGNTGSLLVAARKNGNALATITLDSVQNLTEGNNYPAAIYANTAAQGGDVAISLNPVSGSTGTSVTHIDATDDGTALTYEGLVGTEDVPGLDGYVNVQNPDDLGTLIVQADIGANELTGESTTYTLMGRDVEGIMGTATFEQRANNETLVTLSLEGTPDGGVHPAYIYESTAAEGGKTVVTFNPVDGTMGTSTTNVAAFDDGTAVTYEDLVGYDGYVNVLLSAEASETIVAQGDIGGNALTGESVTYALDSVAFPGIKGEATFYQRSNGTTLVELMLEGTPDGGMHPAYIQANTAAEGGESVIDLTAVDGTTGLSRTQVATFNDGTAVTYDELTNYDGYLNVLLSADVPETIVAQGDIGINALTGESVNYPLAAANNSGVSGTATFAQRRDGTTLVTLVLTGTTEGNTHPAYLLYGSVEEPGEIAIDLTGVDGATGVSKTSVMTTNNNTAIIYEDVTESGDEDLVGFAGHINVYLADDLETVVAQGNVGANVAEEE